MQKGIPHQASSKVTSSYLCPYEAKAQFSANHSESTKKAGKKTSPQELLERANAQIITTKPRALALAWPSLTFLSTHT